MSVVIMDVRLRIICLLMTIFALVLSIFFFDGSNGGGNWRGVM